MIRRRIPTQRTFVTGLFLLPLSARHAVAQKASPRRAPGRRLGRSRSRSKACRTYTSSTTISFAARSPMPKASRTSRRSTACAR